MLLALVERGQRVVRVNVRERERESERERRYERVCLLLHDDEEPNSSLLCPWDL